MGGVEVQEFVDQPQPPAVYGLDAPALKVTVKAKGESWIEVAKKDAAYYARRNGDAAILKLDPAKAEELLKAFAEL
jgi:acyl dehydratase